MQTFIVFRIPDEKSDGNYHTCLENIEDDTLNSLDFSLVKAKNSHEARKKWFYNCYYTGALYDARRECIIELFEKKFESYSEEELISNYGKTDGRILLDLGEIYYNRVHNDYVNAASQAAIDLSEETIAKIFFDFVYDDIAVTSKINKIS